MQSTNIQSVYTLAELFADVVNEIKGSVTAQVTAKDSSSLTITGDFSYFIFANNTENKTDKMLFVSDGVNEASFEGCELLSPTEVKLPLRPASDRSDNAKTGRKFTVGSTVVVSELAPFFFEGAHKELNLLDKYTPAIMLFTPQQEQVQFSEVSQTLISSFQGVTLIFCDNSNDPKKGTGDLFSPLQGFTNDYYLNKIQKPLKLLVNRFLSTLYRFEKTNGYFNIRTEINNVNAVWVTNFGSESGFNTDFTANLSGYVLTMDINVMGAGCAAQID